ncbi:unnamed protein product [Ambrosiozyma monospora]|uniref:Unnamed protein product n=1 Tax=Ambrosiozyma monospora TaxID=43982 RepID=A0A9W7DIW5_AMBMO|nr:unnamed protein product [Ambrosiozyma monospora]
MTTSILKRETNSTSFYSLFIISVFCSLFKWIADVVKQVTSYSSSTNSSNKAQQKKITELPSSASASSSLFPPSLAILKNLTTKDLKACSTGSNSQLVSIINENGQVEFILSDNDTQQDQQEQPLMKSKATQQQKVTEIQQLSPASEGCSPSIKTVLSLPHIPKTSDHLMDSDLLALSPVSSVKSNNSNLCNEVSSAISVTPLAESDHDHSQDENESEHESAENLTGEESEGENKVHQCPHCNSKFRMRGYLTRHIKKHSNQKAFMCPFYDPNAPQKCHATGGFSRRDTYKTHLKARHFKYPPGVKSSDRIGMHGWCGICGEGFKNNEIWVERHITNGQCPGLPQDYVKGLKIGKKKTGKHSKLLDVDDNFQQSINQSSPLSMYGTPSPQSYGVPTPNFSYQPSLKNKLQQFNTALYCSMQGNAAVAQTLMSQQQQQAIQQNMLTPSRSISPPLEAQQQQQNFSSQQQQQNQFIQQQQQQQQQHQQQQVQNQYDYLTGPPQLPTNESNGYEDDNEDFPCLDGECSSETFMSEAALFYHQKQIEAEQLEKVKQEQLQKEQEIKQQQQQLLFNKAYMAVFNSLQPQYQAALNMNMMNMLGSHSNSSNSSQSSISSGNATPSINNYSNISTSGGTSNVFSSVGVSDDFNSGYNSTFNILNLGLNQEL